MLPSNRREHHTTSAPEWFSRAQRGTTGGAPHLQHAEEPANGVMPHLLAKVNKLCTTYFTFLNGYKSKAPHQISIVYYSRS